MDSLRKQYWDQDTKTIRQNAMQIFRGNTEGRRNSKYKCPEVDHWNIQGPSNKSETEDE